MPKDQRKLQDLLEDDEESVTGQVDIAQKDAVKLVEERDRKSLAIKRKLQALREKLAQTQYRQIAPAGRRSRP